MLLLITIILMLFLWILVYLVTKDIVTPVSISGVIWFLLYVVLFFTQQDTILKDNNYCIFGLAFIVFTIGFLFSCPRRKLTNYNIKYPVCWNKRFQRVLLIINYAVALFWILASYPYWFSTSGGIWHNVRLAVELEQSQSLSSKVSGILQTFVLMYFIVSFTFYMMNPKNKRNKSNMLLSLPPLLMVMLLSNRGTWFCLIISIVLIGLLVKDESNGKIIKIGVLGIAGFILIFIISSFQKFSNAYNNISVSEKLLVFFKSYFFAPPVAFVEWLESRPEYYHGAYVFRFILAVLSKLGVETTVVDAVQPFVYIDETLTNVYTALHWYASDFGIFSVVIVEMVLGFFFGVLYKKVRCKNRPSIFSIIAYCMLMYTIVGQFFDEKLFSIASIWIQRFIFLYIFIKMGSFQYNHSKR